MRICVGIVPDFWYDIADENLSFFRMNIYGEPRMGQRSERVLDWESGPGNLQLGYGDALMKYRCLLEIPPLVIMSLDPTRIWDAGYMSEGLMKTDEMDEPHPLGEYVIVHSEKGSENFVPW